MELYKIISQLTEEEFQEIHSNFIANKAEKTADFLEIIRQNPETPEYEFLKKHDITPSAFYVLKSRLNQRIESFLLNRLGDSNLSVLHRILNVGDLVANNPREISVAALRRLERELLRFDFPYGLMIVYKALQNLHSFDDNFQYYRSLYNQQVAYSLGMDKGVDLVVQFFRSYDAFYLSRKEKDHQEMIRDLERMDNLCNLYDSNRLNLFKYVISIYAKLFVEIPDTIRCELEEIEVMFDKSFEILETYKEDSFYSNLFILFNYLRFIYYENNQVWDKATIYFDILDSKIVELLNHHHYSCNTSHFLFRKLRFHKRTNTIPQMVKELDGFLSELEVDPYRLSYFVNFHLFRAYGYFAAGNYQKVTRILYNLRNEINLRKSMHLDLEVRFFLALCYVIIKDYDLANQLILSLQRQLRKETLETYEHAKVLLKILSLWLGGRPKTRLKNLKSNIDRWNELNIGRCALLQDLDLEEIFLSGHIIVDEEDEA